jgi:hypothetical protein
MVSVLAIEFGPLMSLHQFERLPLASGAWRRRGGYVGFSFLRLPGQPRASLMFSPEEPRIAN